MNLKAQPLDVLKHYWGYDFFRFEQEKIINSILAGNDTLALMPTSAGKSICYQVPALCKSGLTLVITPLISLMINQVERLNALGIAARSIHSPMTRQEMEIVINNAINHRLKLLYLSPERAVSSYFLANIKDMPINLIAIDEAHCISKWGYDFRPSYLKLAELRKQTPDTPLLALTATATKEDIKIIQENLLFKKENVISSPLRRDNLNYIVLNEENKFCRLKNIIQSLGGCGIVYVRSRLTATTLSHELRTEGINAKGYHAGMTMIDRTLTQHQWEEGSVSVVVATTAFGMGIDKSDVAWVVHYNLPESLDAYLQEAGRAGRGGQKAWAILMHNSQDEYTLLENINRNFPQEKLILNIYNALGNHYNIACATGEGRKFSFDLTSFAATYNFDIYSLAMSLRILENCGLISILDNGTPVSKVYLYAKPDEIYQFLLSYPIYAPLIDALRRYSEGIHSDFVPISERFIAKEYHFSDSEVSKQLSNLEKLNMLFYDKKSTRPMIEFTAPRVPNALFSLSNEGYYDLKANSLKKAKEVIKYLHSTKCREQYLFSYFGEKTSQCGRCDRCKKMSEQNNQDLQSIRKQLDDGKITIAKAQELLKSRQPLD